MPSTVESEDEGFEEFRRDVVADTREKMETGLFASTLHLQGKVKDKFRGSRGGRTYLKAGHDNVRYQASRPGEPPASPTGGLRNAIVVEGPRWEGRELFGDVGVSLRDRPQARRLELGGAHVTKKPVVVRGINADGSIGFFRVPAGTTINIRPRPYLRPTFLEERDAVVRILDRVLQ